MLKTKKNTCLGSTTRVVEAVNPTILMLSVIDRMEQSGFELRADVKEGLQLSLAHDLTRNTRKYSLEAQDRLESILPYLFREMPNDNLQTALMSAVLFTLNLVDKQKHPDLTSNSISIALLLKHEADTDEGEWQIDWQSAAKSAGRVFTRCSLDGLYLTP